MDEGILRQRRNVVSMSIALSLYILADAKINSILGMEIPKAEVVVIFAWIGFFYFLWRYFIYVNKISIKKLLDEEVGGILYKGNDFLEFSKSEANQIPVEGKLEIHINGQHHMLPYLAASSFKFYLNYTGLMINNGDKITGKVSEDDGLVKIHYFKGVYFLYKSWVKAVFTRPTFTDYMMPYLLAYITICLGIYNFTESTIISN